MTTTTAVLAAALKELVDLKYTVRESDPADYERRKPLAWDTAKRLVEEFETGKKPANHGHKLVVVSGNDWTGLYVNGTLRVENHSLSNREILDGLGLDFEARTVNEAWLGNQGRLPKELEDVVLEGENAAQEKSLPEPRSVTLNARSTAILQWLERNPGSRLICWPTIKETLAAVLSVTERLADCCCTVCGGCYMDCTCECVGDLLRRNGLGKMLSAMRDSGFRFCERCEGDHDGWQCPTAEVP